MHRENSSEKTTTPLLWRCPRSHTANSSVASFTSPSLFLNGKHHQPWEKTQLKSILRKTLHSHFSLGSLSVVSGGRAIFLWCTSKRILGRGPAMEATGNEGQCARLWSRQSPRALLCRGFAVSLNKDRLHCWVEMGYHSPHSQANDPSVSPVKELAGSPWSSRWWMALWKSHPW